jgi:hypothetical protein
LTRNFAPNKPENFKGFASGVGYSRPDVDRRDNDLDWHWDWLWTMKLVSAQQREHEPAARLALARLGE